MFKDIFSVSFTLFAVLDIIGCIPLILALKNSAPKPISPIRATLFSVIIMVFFLYFGSSVFYLFGIQPSHFAVAGSLMILFIGIKMMFGLHFEYEKNNTTEASSNLFPLAFHLIAGPGVLSTIMSLKTDYKNIAIVFGILINAIIIWFVIWSCGWIKRKIGDSGIVIIERMFGVILLSIGIKMFIHNLLIVIHLK